MRYFAAADSGGTKTESVLFDETGHIMAHTRHPGANPMDIGIEESQKTLEAALSEILAKSPSRVTSLYLACAGVEPAGDCIEQYLRPRLDTQCLTVEDDGLCMISGTVGKGDGCSIVCGTGSSLFGRIRGRKHLHIGGVGYLIDTCGSGFELGRDALRAIFRADDGRGPQTVMTGYFLEHFGKPPRRSMMEIYASGRPGIASLSPFVFKGRAAGDAVATEIFEKATDSLAELVFAARPYFKGPFPVVLNGGVFLHNPEYVDSLKSKLPPEARPLLSDIPPIYGAALEALWAAGVEDTPSFREKFRRDYAKMTASLA